MTLDSAITSWFKREKKKFLDITPKEQATKEKTDKLNFNKSNMHQRILSTE